MAQKLQQILGGLENEAITCCRLLAIWPNVVNERVSRNTEPVKIKNRVLYIATRTPVWAQELSFFKQELVGKFNERAGTEVISDIRFKALTEVK